MEELSVLLDNLKSTVECLCTSSQTNTWEVCGGLDRLHLVMMDIFKHGCLSINSNVNDSIWNFLQGINWLYPTITSLNTFSKNSCTQNKNLDKSSIWIYKSLENHTLSEKLGWLLSDKDHLYKYYKPEAYLCHKMYSDSTILCLKVVELHQPTLLLEINPKLYLNYSSKSEHCTTLPKLPYRQTNIDKTIYTNTKHNGLPRYKIKNLSKKQYHKSWPDIYKIFDSPKVDRSLSLDILYLPTHLDQKTVNHSNVLSPTLLDVNYEQLLNDNKQIKRRSKLFTLPLKILEDSDDTHSIKSEGSKTLIPYDEFPSSIYTGTSGLVSAVNFPGQDLFKFLSSGQFVQANAELDRENAHFKISEEIIGTIEQIKCNQKSKLNDKLFKEINLLKQKIRYRRRQKLEVEQTVIPAGTSSSDYLTESTPTDHTLSSTSSYCSTTSSLSTTDDMDELDLDNEFNSFKYNSSNSSSKLSRCSNSSSSFSNMDQMCYSNSSVITAESVARSLIRQISHKNIWPIDVNVQWLITERDAPQQILPLPSSWPVNPYEHEDPKGCFRLRGTNDWAPPRPQIIFTCHPSPIRKKLMEQQNYRCAGCGIIVAVKYASKFRYCFYLGRYFCTGCHVNKTFIIPGRIISKWDFSKYPVSSFSFSLLKKMLFDPLFNIADLNNVLYKHVQSLDKVRSYRVQLYYIKDFIFSCRYANRLKESLNAIESHIILKPDLYSIQNMVDVKYGEFGKTLQNIIISCNKHIINCQLCQARGFVCEICNKNEVIFPWNFRLVTRCMDCGSCYHKKCFSSQKMAMCPRCPRISAMFKRADNQNNQNVVLQSEEATFNKL